MIRTDREYKEMKLRLSKAQELLVKQRKTLAAEGLTASEAKRALAPTISFQKKLFEEVEFYEQLKQGKLPSFDSFRSIGQILIALRIAGGMTQRELAQRLDVSETIVSRDERNEYHGITMERAQRILEAIGGKVELRPQIPA